MKETKKVREQDSEGEIKYSLLSLVNVLKEHREALGFSQRDIVKKSKLSLSTICYLETGRTINPRIMTLYRYASSVGLFLSLKIEDRKHI